MRNVLILLAGLASAGAALAQVDPTHLMITGIGNANAKPGDFVVTNQTESSNTSGTSTGETTTLEKFVVTGSLLGHEAKASKAPTKHQAAPPASASAAPGRDGSAAGQSAGPRA